MMNEGIILNVIDDYFACTVTNPRYMGYTVTCAELQIYAIWGLIPQRRSAKFATFAESIIAL